MPTISENGIHPGYKGRVKSTKHNSNKTQSAARGTIMGNERQHRRKDAVPPGCPKVRCGLLSKDSNKIILTELMVQWEERWKNGPLKERRLNPKTFCIIAGGKVGRHGYSRSRSVVGNSLSIQEYAQGPWNKRRRSQHLTRKGMRQKSTFWLRSRREEIRRKPGGGDGSDLVISAIPPPEKCQMNRGYLLISSTLNEGDALLIFL